MPVFRQRALLMVVLVVAVAIGGCSGGGAVEAPPPDEASLSRLQLIGKRIFFDTTLSNPAGQACGSCHVPATAFSGNFGSTVGVPFAADGMTLGLRNTPTAMYASFTPRFSVQTDGVRLIPLGGLFLDGRVAGLEEQARMPFFSAGEMNIANDAELSARLANAAYAPLMLEEFGAALFADPKAAVDAATRAIAAFERTAAFAPFSSKFDGSLAGTAVLSELEREGMRLFEDTQKGNCTRCHAFKPATRDPAELLFTNFEYNNIGVPRNQRIPANADPGFFDLGLCGPRRERLADERLCGAFKVPTLRNVARRQAFMHNGFFTSLRDVVAFYATRDTTPGRWYPAGTYLDDVPATYVANIEVSLAPFRPAAGSVARLNDHEIDAITAFLAALDDGYGPSRVPGAN